ncbi:hypothetical protein RND71_014508 [Anisodus tanguticus]|uniref:RING-type E3 ubiquitin transferase n=1 Tax=Anisodus tanguticus TaxID=243964 RepID=A0AAE1S9V0_9SOLA|nr:hypothetical protein RND71_014508 [Anisodus tanguticus]
MPVVKVIEEGVECSICLSEFKVGGDAKEMTCKHRYHLDCLDKWLRINGSSPICRYKMPVDEEKVKEVEPHVESHVVSQVLPSKARAALLILV